MGNANHVIAAEFCDFDAYVEAIEDAEVEMTISSLDFNRWSVHGIYLPGGMHVQTASEGAGTICLGVNPDAGCNIFVHRDGLMLANGEEMLPGSAFVMPARSEFVLSNASAHRWYTIHVPEVLRRELGLNEYAPGKQYQRPHVVRLAQPNSDLLWQQITRFLSATAAGPEISASAEASANFRTELVHTLRRSFGQQVELPSMRRGRPVVTDRLTVARAIDAIEASQGSGLPMEELVRITGVSERSLRAGFCRYLGISPKRYMQLRALNRARKRLSRARPEELTVTRVAADLGLWDVGRFAMRYKKTFGESPSETLQSIS